MFEITATQDPAGFLAAVSEQLAKVGPELWRACNEGFAEIAASMDTLGVSAGLCPGRAGLAG